MLSPRAEAPTANPDGRSAPEVSLDTRTWRGRADTTGHWGRFRREMGLLMLHGDGRQGYSIPGNAPASCVSGECRMIGFNSLGRMGRLGNQMFQYAALLSIARHHQYEFCIPPSDFTNEWTDHQLFKAFDLPSLRCVGWIRTTQIARESTHAYDKELFDSCENYVDIQGFFQTERYFVHIGGLIAHEFRFKSHIFEKCQQFIVK